MGQFPLADVVCLATGWYRPTGGLEGALNLVEYLTGNRGNLHVARHDLIDQFPWMADLEMPDDYDTRDQPASDRWLAELAKVHGWSLNVRAPHVVRYATLSFDFGVDAILRAIDSEALVRGWRSDRVNPFEVTYRFDDRDEAGNATTGILHVTGGGLTAKLSHIVYTRDGSCEVECELRAPKPEMGNIRKPTSDRCSLSARAATVTSSVIDTVMFVEAAQQAHLIDAPFRAIAEGFDLS